MKELGMTLGGCGVIIGFFALLIYPNLEVKNQPSNRSCIDDCYIEYTRKYGNTVDILRAQQQAALGDPFSDIRSLWTGCAACHGADGGGGIGPKLAGQTADYISGRLITYKNNGIVGSQSALMWGQAGMLSDKDIQTIGDLIATELK
jgi:cytochrome c553